MAEFDVYYPIREYARVTVTVPDDLDEEEQVEYALDHGTELLPTDLCFQCYGWGKKHTLEIDFSTLEASRVEKKDEWTDTHAGERPLYWNETHDL